MDQQPQVIVRNAARHDVCLRGTVALTPDLNPGVRFAAAAGGKEGWIDVDVVDLGAGGIGFISMVFFPRKAVLTIRVYGPQEENPLMLTASLRVQRVCMTDRRPAYLVGASYESMTDETRAQLDAMLHSLSGT